MDSFIQLSPDERRVVFEGTAAARNLQALIIEKDFWVCRTLKVLFGLPAMDRHLIFKGGTSLSKVLQVIERFSETTVAPARLLFLQRPRAPAPPGKMFSLPLPPAEPVESSRFYGRSDALPHRGPRMCLCCISAQENADGDRAPIAVGTHGAAAPPARYQGEQWPPRFLRIKPDLLGMGEVIRYAG